MKTFKNKKIGYSLYEMKKRVESGDLKPINPQPYQRTVYVYDLQGNQINSYPSCYEVARQISEDKISPATIASWIKYRKPYNGMYFSYDKNFYLDI